MCELTRADERMKTYTLPNGVIGCNLFKYRRIDDFLFDSIANARLWFSDPLQFNDPYDCNLDFTVGLQDDWYEHLFNAVPATVLTRERQELRERFERDPDAAAQIKRRLEQIEYGNIRKQIGARGVCCFGRVDDNLLMWAHYADKHSGVCLTFDISEDETFFNAPYLVEYREELPQYNLLDVLRKLPHTGIVQHILATKSKEWEYEQEVRIIKWSRFGPFRGLLEFKKRALTEVTFGHKTRAEDKKRVAVLLAGDAYKHVRLSEMRLSQGAFALIKMPYNACSSTVEQLEQHE